MQTTDIKGVDIPGLHIRKVKALDAGQISTVKEVQEQLRQPATYTSHFQ